MALVYNLDFISDKSKKSSIKKALSILERSFYKSLEESSFFLDPFEQDVLESIARTNNIEMVFVGGNENAERKVFIANPYYTPVDPSNYIRVLRFNHQNLSHPDVLGALMSLNIDREVIGDIIIDGNTCEFTVLKNDADFIRFNLRKIKREPIDIKIKKDTNLQIPMGEYEEYGGFISSLRLDNVVSELTNSSRTKAKDIIKNKLVKVNYEIIDDPSKIVPDDSMISIRHEGRFIFDGVTGKSKKGNHHISYRKLVWFM